MGYTSSSESNSVSTSIIPTGLKVIKTTKKPGADGYPPCPVLTPAPQISEGAYTLTISRTRSRTNGYDRSRYMPPTPYNFSKVDDKRRGVVSGLINFDTWNSCIHWCTFQGDATPYTYPSLPSPSQASIDATLVKASNAILDQKVNLAQAFAERRQAVSMVTRRIQQLSLAASAVRRGKFSKAAKVLGCSATPSNVWLEWRYGWKPLISDVYGTLELIQKYDQVNPDRYVISGKGSVSLPTPTDNTATNMTIHFSDIVEGIPCTRTRSNAKLGVFSRLDYQVPRATVLRSLVSAGILDPVSLAWELTPYSFIVDWFVNVGDWLSFQTFDTGLHYMGGSTSVIKRQTIEWLPDSAFNIGTKRYSSVSGKQTITEVNLSRTVYPTRPSLNVNWNPRLTNSRYLDALALLSQEMRKAR